MAMPELTKEQKAALVVSRMARTVAFSKSERGISITLSPGAFLFTFTETKFGTILITRREIAAIK